MSNISNEQVGNRIPTIPSTKPTESVKTEQNPVKYDTFQEPMQSGSAGGGKPWKSFPHEAEQVLTHHT